MNTAEATIRINVDPTNPGQFFACCGLLEFADRLWPGAEVVACFSALRFQRSLFSLSAQVPLCSSDLVKLLVNCERNAVDPYRPVRGSDGKPVKDAKKTNPVLLRSNDNSGGKKFSRNSSEPRSVRARHAQMHVLHRACTSGPGLLLP